MNNVFTMFSKKIHSSFVLTMSHLLWFICNFCFKKQRDIIPDIIFLPKFSTVWISLSLGKFKKIEHSQRSNNKVRFYLNCGFILKLLL